MKLIYINLFLLICLGIFLVSNNILAKAVFPDSSQLQPIEKNVFPNISNNFGNSANQQNISNSKLYSKEMADNSRESATLFNDKKNKNSFLIMFSILVGIIITFVFVVLRFKRK